MFLQAAKKGEERRFVEILAKELDAFPPSKLIDSESPDFLVATSEGVLGIEVTKIHHATEPRQQESECRSLVEAACRLYENESTIRGQHAIQQAKQRQIRENLVEPSTREYSTA